MVLAMTDEDLQAVDQQVERDAAVPDNGRYADVQAPDELDWSGAPRDVRLLRFATAIVSAVGPWIARLSWRTAWLAFTRWTMLALSFVFTLCRWRVEWQVWQDRKSFCDVCEFAQLKKGKRFCCGEDCGCPDTFCSTVDYKIRWHNFSCPLRKFGRGDYFPPTKGE